MHKNWSLKSIQKYIKGGKHFKHKKYKKRWMQQINNGGTQYEKFREIDKHVWNKFHEKRIINLKPVHYYDLKRWASEKSELFKQADVFINEFW